MLGGKIVIFILSDTIGSGSDELGRILMRNFLITLKGLPSKPWKIILMNGGVKLSSKGSELVGALKELEQSGVEILSCGTCLDYFHLKEDLEVGKASNMQEISTSLMEASKIISP